MSKLGTTVLDTDSIIKTSIILEGKEESLLGNFLKLDGTYYIHKHIHTEVEWPETSKELLDKLISQGKIKVLSDRDLIELLEEQYTMSYRTFLSNLKICCEIFNTDYYEDYYIELENFHLKNIEKEEFLTRLKKIENSIMKSPKNNLGELKTALMSAILYIIKNTKVNVFVSDDKRARRSMVLQYSIEYHQIKALSVLGIFYVLRNTLDKEKAKKYIEKLPQDNFKIYDIKNNMIKKNGNDVIELIYSNKVTLFKDGVIKLNN